jgi:hypothetical protein
MKTKSYEFPHCAAFSNHLPLYLSLVQIFSSAPCSERPLVYVPPIISEARFHTHREPWAIMILYILIFNFLGSRSQKGLDWIVASITLIQSPFNFLLNQILTSYFCSKIFELSYIFRGSVSYLYVVVLPCILVTRQQYLLSFLCLLLDQPPY